MENWIKNVRIKNFKSLREVSLDCERINLFVGRPNVGKSNLLEAMALLGPDFINSGPFGKSIIRYTGIDDLFFDNNYLEESIKVSADERITAQIVSSGDGFKYLVSKDSKGSEYIDVNIDGSIGKSSLVKGAVFFPIKYYIFPENQLFTKNSQSLPLIPPHGENLLYLLQHNKSLRQEASDLFEPYGLELLLDPQDNRLDVVKRRDGILFKTPFSLVADTLRRYLFHLAAVESNRDAILLFEEPESHNYPPYVQRLAQRIMEDASNQYFITTHSPFLFNKIVEAEKNVAVFMVDYENYQTKVSRLSEENLREILDYGLNIFTEQELFA